MFARINYFNALFFAAILNTFCLLYQSFIQNQGVLKHAKRWGPPHTYTGKFVTAVPSRALLTMRHAT